MVNSEQQATPLRPRPGRLEATLGRSIVIGHGWTKVTHPDEKGYRAGMGFHDITMTSITGDQVSFDDFRGKLALVVNVASA